MFVKDFSEDCPSAKKDYIGIATSSSSGPTCPEYTATSSSKSPDQEEYLASEDGNSDSEKTVSSYFSDD